MKINLDNIQNLIVRRALEGRDVDFMFNYGDHHETTHVTGVRDYNEYSDKYDAYWENKYDNSYSDMHRG